MVGIYFTFLELGNCILEKLRHSHGVKNKFLNKVEVRKCKTKDIKKPKKWELHIIRYYSQYDPFTVMCNSPDELKKNYFLKMAYLNCSESWFIVWTICFMELDFKTISISVQRKAAM